MSSGARHRGTTPSARRRLAAEQAHAPARSGEPNPLVFRRDPDLQRPQPARALPGEHRASIARPIPKSRSKSSSATTPRPTAPPTGSRPLTPASASSAPSATAASAPPPTPASRPPAAGSSSCSTTTPRSPPAGSKPALAPFTDPVGRLGRSPRSRALPARPRRLRRRFLQPGRLARPSAATASPPRSSPAAPSKKSSAPADRVRSTAPTSSSGWAASIRSTAPITKTSISPSA